MNTLSISSFLERTGNNPSSPVLNRAAYTITEIYWGAAHAKAKQSEGDQKHSSISVSTSVT